MRGPFFFLLLIEKPFGLRGCVVFATRGLTSIETLGPHIAVGLFDLPVHVAEVALEFANAFSDRSANLRDALRAEDDKDNHEDHQQFERSNVTEIHTSS